MTAVRAAVARGWVGVLALVVLASTGVSVMVGAGLQVWQGTVGDRDVRVHAGRVAPPAPLSSGVVTVPPRHQRTGTPTPAAPVSAPPATVTVPASPARSGQHAAFGHRRALEHAHARIPVIVPPEAAPVVPVVARPFVAHPFVPPVAVPAGPPIVAAPADGPCAHGDDSDAADDEERTDAAGKAADKAQLRQAHELAKAQHELMKQAAKLAHERAELDRKAAEEAAKAQREAAKHASVAAVTVIPAPSPATPAS